MKNDMKIFSAGSSISIIADEFEQYIEKTAEHVTGDVVLSALSRIKYARRESEALYELSKKFELKPRESE